MYNSKTAELCNSKTAELYNSKTAELYSSPVLWERETLSLWSSKPTVNCGWGDLCWPHQAYIEYYNLRPRQNHVCSPFFVDEEQMLAVLCSFISHPDQVWPGECSQPSFLPLCLWHHFPRLWLAKTGNWWRGISCVLMSASLNQGFHSSLNFWTKYLIRYFF